MTNIYVKPRDGYTIMDPVLRDYLPPAGRLVGDSEYWQRRIRDEDVSLELVPLEGNETKPVPAVPADAKEG